jgi:hypothetical protein
MGSAWKVVQNGTNASSFGNDEDDSSGMAWVKKRRAEREKAKLEAQKKEQEHGDGDFEMPEPTITEKEEQETPRLPEEHSTPHPPIDTPTVALAEEPHEAPQHITTAINLPPQRPHKREASFGHRIQIPQVESPTKENPSFGDDVFDMELGGGPEAATVTPEASTGSTSEDEDESSSSGSEEDEDESDVYSEVRIPPFSVHTPPTDLGRFRRMPIARRPWALVSRKSADIRTYLSRRPPICRTPL